LVSGLHEDYDEEQGLQQGMGLMIGNRVYNNEQGLSYKMEFIIQGYVHRENWGWRVLGCFVDGLIFYMKTLLLRL